MALTEAIDGALARRLANGACLESCVALGYDVDGLSSAARLLLAKKKDIVQVKNPKSGRYVKIDRDAGKILAHKKSAGPYKGVPVARKKKAK